MSASRKKSRTASKSILRALLVLVVTTGGVGRAQATPVTDTATTSAVGMVATAVGALSAELLLYANQLSSAISGMGVGVVTAMEAQIDADRQLGQAQWDASYALHNAKLAADAVKDDPPTDEAYESLCRSVRGGQVAEYSRAISGNFQSRLLKGWEEDDRGFENGRGVQYVQLTQENRCGANTNGGGGFFHPLDMPPDKKCLPNNGNPGATPEEEAQIRERYNADISAGTIFRDVTQEPLERPSINSTTGKLVPDHTRHSQIMWMAGQSFCYHIAGGHPSPPKGNELSLTEGDGEGQSRSVNHSTCKAIKSAYVNECFAQLEYVSRPNCKDTSDPDIVKSCAQHKAMCQDAIAASGPLEKSFGTCGQDGGDGLSQLQIDSLNKRKCLTTQYYVTQRITNSKAADLAMQNELCQIDYTAGKSELLQKKLAFLSSLNGLHNLRSCWESVK